MGYENISIRTPLGQFIASFAMILGYGIIAVPTGIVTAKMVQKPSSYSKTLCRDCGVTDYPTSTKFCHNCGNSL